MKKHFVTFYSPGTFVAEETTKEIKSWDVDLAVAMSKSILERYDATPYGFVFTTRERKSEDFDSKEIDRSGTYYLGGKVLTAQDIEKENNPDNEILLRNMKNNEWKKIVRNDNSWRWIQPLRDNDTVLDIS